MEEESICFRNRGGGGKYNNVISQEKGTIFYSNFSGEKIVYFKNREKKSVIIYSLIRGNCILLLTFGCLDVSN